MEKWNQGQVPDTKPGPYYVSAKKEGGDTFWVMRGPFDTHQEALEKVQETMNKACDLDAKAHWMAWGTCRIEGSEQIGKLNDHFDTDRAAMMGYAQGIRAQEAVQS